MPVGGIVLCGGRSSRMGRPKALLPVGAERMLQRVVRLLGQAVQPLAVVAAPGQELPALPEEVAIVHDRHEGCGPLEGLAVGLAAIQDRADAAYVTSCDVPLLVPDFVRELVRLLAPDDDVAVPVEGALHHPLAAVYRTGVVPEIEALLAADRRRPVFLYDRVRTRRVPVESLRHVDPPLQSLRNVNHPDDYFAALRSLGLRPEPVEADRKGSGGVFGQGSSHVAGPLPENDSRPRTTRRNTA